MDPTPALSLKAHRLLTTGAVTVLTAGPGRATVEVVGDHGTHTVERRRGGWHCACPAHGNCSHLTAARLITERTNP